MAGGVWGYGSVGATYDVEVCALHGQRSYGTDPIRFDGKEFPHFGVITFGSKVGPRPNVMIIPAI